MSDLIKTDKATGLQKVSDALGGTYTAGEIGVIQQSVAKGTTTTELAYFLNVAKSMGLNPFNKEVWCYKDNRGNVLIFAGRDGFLAKAQQSPVFNGIRSIEICENDEYELDIAGGMIHHKIKDISNRGKILGAVAFVFRKDGEPTVEFAEFKTYNKGFNAWKSHPAEMIKKVAECHALKKAFGISGIQSEYDFEVKGGVVQPNTVEIKETVDPAKQRAINLFNSCTSVEELLQHQEAAINNGLQDEFNIRYAELEMEVA